MEKLEEVRHKIKSRYITIIMIIVLVCIFAISIGSMILFILAIFLGIFTLLFSTYKLKKEYTNIFKKVFVLKSLESKFSDLVYNPERGIAYQTIKSTNMMYMGDRYHSEDYISAKYKGIQFEQSDVHIEEEHTSTDSDGHTTTTYDTIFKGRWMIFDFNKTFKADVQISQKGFRNSKVTTFFGNREEKFKKVSMESENFNHEFNVYAQNEHDAFYIITPSLMSKIEKLAQMTKGKLLLCFIDNRLHIGIHDNKDSFEPPSVFKKIDEAEMIHEISKDIELITQFVDELNLDNNLFKKEV